MRRSAVILAVAGACAACVAVPCAPPAAAAPAWRLGSSNQGYADPAGDADSSLAPDLTEITAFDNANGALGFRISYANRACIGAGDSVAVFLDVDRNPATGSSSGGFEYELLLDGASRTASVARWTGSAFAPSTLPAAGGCSSTSSADSLVVTAASLGIGSSFDFVAETSWSGGAGAPSYHDQAGPFVYTMTPPPPLPPPPRPRPARPVVKSYTSAPLLVPQARYTGTSIKDVQLTEAVYATMKSLGVPRLLAVACWSTQDWFPVLASAGGRGSDEPGVVTLAFWFSGQPRWLHLSPATCTNVQALIDSRVPNSSRAQALATVLHETTHAYGVRNEAQANCYGVQLVYPFARELGFGAARAARLEDLALRATRSSAPPGYWDAARCRAGGAWDLSR